eukprot:scaffold564_cov172-Ochromonas_danica.AAC.1
MLSEAKANAMERERALKKSSKVGTLLRKKVKVTDFADDGVAISIEQDWDTSSWNDNLVEAGCEALIYVFYDLYEVSSLERKNKALQMLQKLLNRHNAAELFLRKNLEMLIGKATSRLIRNGTSCGVLNLLYVLDGCKEKFTAELSNFKFNGRAVEMLLVEAKVAAVLIQHTFRARKSKKQLQSKLPSGTLEQVETETRKDLNGTNSKPAIDPITAEHIASFGTEKEVFYRKMRVINARSTALRKVWRKMHDVDMGATTTTTASLPTVARDKRWIGGLRGPIHLDGTHVHLALQIIAYLVSDVCQGFTQGNREDVVRAQGCIILSTFLACPTSPFVFQAAKILSEVSKVSESFFYVISAGVIQSTFRFMKYARTVHGIGTKVIHKAEQSNKDNKLYRENQLLLAFLNCFDIIIYTSEHAAGIYRAFQGYDFIKLAYGTVEQTDYHALLLYLHRSNTITDLEELVKQKQLALTNKYKINYKDNPPGDIKPPNVTTNGQPVVTLEKMLQGITSLLADGYLLKELSTIILEVPQISLLKRALRCLLTFLSSYAHYRVVEEITAYGGKLLIKLIDLLSHDEEEIALLVVLVAMQFNTQRTSRKALFTIHVAKYLLDFQQAVVKKNGGFLLQHNANNGSVKTKLVDANPSYAYIQDPVFERSIFFTVSLCRQFDWRLYDSNFLYNEITSSARATFCKRYLYLDLLISMKIDHVAGGSPSPQRSTSWFAKATANTPYSKANTDVESYLLARMRSSHEKQSKSTFQEDIEGILNSITNDNIHLLTISDWIIIPNQYPLCLGLSQQMSVLAPEIIANYFIHPENPFYYEALPLHESVAVCQLIEGLCAFHQTARLIYSRQVVLFLIKFIYLNKFLFLGKDMDAMTVRVLLNGIKSSFIALGRLCIAIKETIIPAEEYIDTIKKHDFLSNAIFFLDTLSVFNHTIPFNVLQLQKEVGIVCLEYFAKYANMLNYLQYQLHSPIAKISDLYDIAKLVVRLLHNLHQTYEVYLTHQPQYRQQLHNEEIHIHDKMCSMLCMVCQHKEAAYTALTEWSIQAALQRYMPPPLSGLPNISHGGKFKSFIRSSQSSTNLNLDLITGDSPRKRGSISSSVRVRNRSTMETARSHDGQSTISSSQMRSQKTQLSLQRSPTNRTFNLDDLEEDDDNFVDDYLPPHRHYALELLELPASFFELCSCLGAIDSGLSFCMVSGFLRRALDKLMILHYQLVRAKVIYPRQFLQIIKWEDRKYDFAGCFRLMCTMANYHHPQHGSSNELILSSLYNIFEIARDILNLKIKRQEEVILVIYECLASLSKDSFRVSQLIEEYDLLTFIQRELYLLDEFPARGAEAAVNVLHFSCHGLTSAYIIRLIPLLREALSKTSRVYPHLDEAIRRAHWTLTKSAMIYKSTVDSSYHVDEENINQLHVEIERFIRTGDNADRLDYKGVASYYQVNYPVDRMDTYKTLASNDGEGILNIRKSSNFTTNFLKTMHLKEDTVDDLKDHRLKRAIFYSEPKHDGSVNSTILSNLDDMSTGSHKSSNSTPKSSRNGTPRKNFATKFNERLHLQNIRTTPVGSPMHHGSRANKARDVRSPSGMAGVNPAIRRLRGYDSPRRASSPKSRDSPRTPNSSRRAAQEVDITSSILQKTADVLESTSGRSSLKSQSQDVLGEYSHCGVTTCGSLRFPHICSAPVTPLEKRDSGFFVEDRGNPVLQTVHEGDMPNLSLLAKSSTMPNISVLTYPTGGMTSEHGAFTKLSSDDVDRLSRGLRFPEAEKEEILPMSHLSARESGLQELIAYRKGKDGFGEIQKVDVYNLSPYGTGKSNKPLLSPAKGNYRMTASTTGAKKRLKPKKVEPPVIPVLSVNDMPDLKMTRPPPATPLKTKTID